MSGFDDWPHIDELFRKLAGLLSSARQARNTLQASIDARQLHIARYPSFGDVTRWEQISACDAGWWRGRRLVPDGDILRLTKPDGVIEDHEWQIVVSPEDTAALWPSIATPDAPPVTPSKTLPPKQKLVSDILDELEKEALFVDAMPILQQLDLINERIKKLSPGNNVSERTLRSAKKARKG